MEKTPLIGAFMWDDGQALTDCMLQWPGDITRESPQGNDLAVDSSYGRIPLLENVCLEM